MHDSDARKWVLGHRDLRDLRVAGFGNRDEARGHAKRHFLSPKERWDDLKPSPSVAVLIARLAADDHNATLTAAAQSYEAAVERTTSGDCVEIFQWIRIRLEPDESRQTRLVGVSVFGIFFVFGQQLHLCTAYRPTPRVMRGRLVLGDFLAQARKKFAMVVARDSE
jgi:hypothetical protein